MHYEYAVRANFRFSTAPDVIRADFNHFCDLFDGILWSCIFASHYMKLMTSGMG